MPLPLVVEWLGHAKMDTTRRFYVNADTTMKREAIDKATSDMNPQQVQVVIFFQSIGDQFFLQFQCAAVHRCILKQLIHIFSDSQVIHSDGRLPAPLLGDGIVVAACSHFLISPVGGNITRLLKSAKGGIQSGLLQFIAVVRLAKNTLINLIAVAVVLHQAGKNDGLRVPTDVIGGD